VSLSCLSGGGMIGVPERVAGFKEASTLLAELRQLADRDALAHHSAAIPSLTLQDSYRACEAITRTHSRSFFFSSQLLPRAKRHAVRALYAFCRTSDDLVDQPGRDPAAALAAWVQHVHTPQLALNHPVLMAWNDTARRYAIPQELVDELLAGIAMDLTISRYATFDDLWVYCYRVASVVGLLSMQIVGADPAAVGYAIRLGVALQLTNILRDVGEDAQRGRIYLPQEDLARFGLTDREILDGCDGPRFQALMRFEIARAEQLYTAAWPGIMLLSPDSRLAIGAAAEIYRAILAQIAANKYDVFTRRAHVPLVKKLRILRQVHGRLLQHA
jgi:phytoene synthase